LAEEALERGDLDVADTHALAAVRHNPKSPEHAALQVWIASKINVELPEAVRSFSRILDESPECEPALYYRGMLLKEAGKDRAALKDFVTLVRLNPDHAKGLVEVKRLRARMPK
jgi:tetratricopeptide (TPR) repeat protein